MKISVSQGIRDFIRMQKRRRRRDGGVEPVTVEPDRPKLGQGGAEAPLEFDDRP